MQCRLEQIFDTQGALIKKYHPIYQQGGFNHVIPGDFEINDPHHQNYIKELAWNFVEEIGEAMNEVNCNSGSSVKEELIDALHFLTEITLISGMNYDQVSDFELQADEVDYLHQLHNDGMEILSMTAFRSNVVESILTQTAMMCNTLKNRPWCQTPRETDEKLFKQKLRSVWIQFFALLASCMTTDEIYIQYINKSAKNTQRQSEGY